VTQHVHEWCSSFGTTAAGVVNDFFELEDNANEFSDNESHISFCEHMVNNLRFLFSTADGDDLFVSDTISFPACWQYLAFTEVLRCILFFLHFASIHLPSGRS
jgi:hypothetical protein